MSDVLIYDITIHAGTDYAIDFDYTDDDEVSVDVSGWSVEAQIREFTESLNAIAFDCTTDASGYHLTMDSEKTAKIMFSRGVYDVFITDLSGIRSKLIQGHAAIIHGATR